MRYLAVVLLFVMAAGATASSVHIGGIGAISTSDEPYGSLGLLDGGETATAILDFAVSGSNGDVFLTLTVTNTSPALLGTESPLIPDAPVIADIFFGIPGQVDMMSLLTVDGESASTAGWAFIFDPDAAPSSGYGFLKSTFDGALDGGPGAGDPDPVIGSIFDPDLGDEPGVPNASPVAFLMMVTLERTLPSGFNADWFCDPASLGYPDYIAAAKFMSGANGGSGTVTDGVTVPLPGGAVLGAAGLCGLLLAGRFKSWRARRNAPVRQLF